MATKRIQEYLDAVRKHATARDKEDEAWRQEVERMAHEYHPDADKINILKYEGEYYAEIWDEGYAWNNFFYREDYAEWFANQS